MVQRVEAGLRSDSFVKSNGRGVQCEVGGTEGCKGVSLTHRAVKFSYES